MKVLKLVILAAVLSRGEISKSGEKTWRELYLSEIQNHQKIDVKIIKKIIQIRQVDLYDVAVSLGTDPLLFYERINQILLVDPRGPIRSRDEIAREALYRTYYNKDPSFGVRETAAILGITISTLYDFRIGRLFKEIQINKPPFAYVDPMPVLLTLKDYERLEFIRAFAHAEWNMTCAAAMMSGSRSAMWNWMKNDKVLKLIRPPPSISLEVGKYKEN